MLQPSLVDRVLSGAAIAAANAAALHDQGLDRDGRPLETARPEDKKSSDNS